MKIRGNLTGGAIMIHYLCFHQTLYQPCFKICQSDKCFKFVNLTNKYQCHVSICQSDRNTFQDHQESLTQIRDSNRKMGSEEKEEQEEMEEKEAKERRIGTIRMAGIEGGKA